MPRAWLWEDSTAGEDADSNCVPPALRNTPPPLLWLFWATQLCPPHAARKRGGGGARAQPVSCANGFFCKFSMRAARKQGVQAVPVECPVQGGGWQWRHNMRRHYEQQHPDHQLPNERAAQWDWGPEELIVLGEGEGAFWDNKRKFRWTQLERKQKRKKMRTALRDALQGDRGEEGGTGLAPPRLRVEEDDSEASVALPRGSDQGRRDLRLAEAQDQNFVPGDSSASDSDSDSDSDSGWSDGSASGEGARTDPQASQSSATPSKGSRNLSQASARQRDLSPARSTISVSSTSSRGRRPRPQPLSALPAPTPPPSRQVGIWHP